MYKIKHELVNLYSNDEVAPVIVTTEITAEILDVFSMQTGIERFAIINTTKEIESVLIKEEYEFSTVKIDSESLPDLSETHALVYIENETAGELGSLIRELLTLDTEYDFFVIYVTKHTDPFEFEAQAAQDLHESLFQTDIELSTLDCLKNIYDDGDNATYPSTHYIDLYVQVSEDKTLTIGKYEGKYPSLAGLER